MCSCKSEAYVAYYCNYKLSSVWFRISSKGRSLSLAVNNFQRDIWFFSGVTIYFFNLMYRVLCYQQMQRFRVNWTYSRRLEEKLNKLINRRVSNLNRILLASIHFSTFILKMEYNVSCLFFCGSLWHQSRLVTKFDTMQSYSLDFGPCFTFN